MFYTWDLTSTPIIQLATVVLNTLNNMKAGIDSSGKSILLRVDVHLCMEFHIFVLYPTDANGFVSYFDRPRDRYSDCPKLFR